MYDNELQVAKKAETMLESALRSKTASFKDHISRKAGDVSLKQATAVAKVKKYGTKKSGNQQVYMRSLAIKMAKHGFIQHFGVDTVRSGGNRTRKNPRETTYNFKSHVMKMKAQPFIKEAVKNSGVVDFVMENLTRIQSEGLLVEVKRILENN
jgi:hypothetical protein